MSQVPQLNHAIGDLTKRFSIYFVLVFYVVRMVSKIVVTVLVDDVDRRSG